MIDASFLKRYHDALKKCVMTSDMHDKYRELCEDYDEAKRKMDAALESAGSICSDAECLIDKSTGELKRHALLVLGEDAALLRMANELCELWQRLHSFAEFGWTDELGSSIDPVLAIAEYSEMEHKIIDELGLDEGQRVIYEIKKRVVEFEETIGKDFFREDVLKLRDLFRFKRLLAKPYEIKLGQSDNLDTQDLVLTNNDGETFRCEKVAQIAHNGSQYVEIELREDVRICVFNYYLVADDACRELRLVEDRDLVKLLDTKRDRL